MRYSIPKRFAPQTHGILQSAIMSAIAATMAVVQAPSNDLNAVTYWFTCLSSSWLAMLPVVILVSPIIQRVVLALTEPPQRQMTSTRSARKAEG